MRLTVGNIKGGVGKSTSAIMLALALARAGRRVLLVDGDLTNRTCLKWKAAATDWPELITVVSFGDDLARSVLAMMAAGGFDDLIIDTNPNHHKVLRQALTVTDQLLIPVSPSPVELEQLPDTLALAAEIDVTSPVLARVLLVMVIARTNSLAQSRAWLAAHDPPVPVMDVEVHRREAYRLAYGSVPADLGDYPAVLAEFDATSEAA